MRIKVQLVFRNKTIRATSRIIKYKNAHHKQMHNQIPKICNIIWYISLYICLLSKSREHFILYLDITISIGKL